MANPPITKVHLLHASTEVPSGPPPVNWDEMDKFDPHWLMAFVWIAGVCLALRFSVAVFGHWGTCVVGWLAMCFASYGWAGFMINPMYCILMSILAGSVTWIVFACLYEAVTGPGRIWSKITR